MRSIGARDRGNGNCSTERVFASIAQTALLLSAHASNYVRADGDGDSPAWLQIGGLVMAFWLIGLWLRPPPLRKKRARRQRPARVSPLNDWRTESDVESAKAYSTTSVQAGPPEEWSSAPESSQRRVISLHAVTPGQSQQEYNVGDRSGTRGHH